MGTVINIRHYQVDGKLDLFERSKEGAADVHRQQHLRMLLAEKAKQISDLLDGLESVIGSDRERAMSMLAEYSTLMDDASSEVSSVRRISEELEEAILHDDALRLERGIRYLIGLFSAMSSGEIQSDYDWKQLELDVRELLGLCVRLANGDNELLEAA